MRGCTCHAPSACAAPLSARLPRDLVDAILALCTSAACAQCGQALGHAPCARHALCNGCLWTDPIYQLCFL